MILQEISNFLAFHEQKFEVNPTDYPAVGCDFIIFREQRLYIIIRYLSRDCDTELTNFNADFRVINLWEDVWRTSPEIVKSRLRSALGKSFKLPGRVTKVRRIDKPTADAFLKKNHLQGSPKAKFKYGLFLPKSYYRLVENKSLIDEKSDETLVAVATFAAPKTYYRDDADSRSIELIHFANHVEFTVIGGLNKLLKFLEKEQQPGDIMTYVDADWSDGKGFEKLGFNHVEKLPPIAFFVHKKTHERLRHLPKNESESDYVKVYNSGSWKMLKVTK